MTLTPEDERHALVVHIAQAFSRKLREYLPEATMRKVVAGNRAEQDAYVCHSHDYLDANMVMLEAWQAVRGREPDVGSSDDCELWNEAWDHAKNHEFAL